MDVKFDNFKLDDEDIYRLQRQDTQNVEFGYFTNFVSIDTEAKTLSISVDHTKEEELIFSNERAEEMKIFKKKKRGRPKEPFRINPHSGKRITSQIGEQLIAFAETDFGETIKDALTSATITEYLQNGSEYGKPKEFNPKNHDEIDAHEIHSYMLFRLGSVEFLEKNLYVDLFPPYMKNLTWQAAWEYFQYVSMLQKEYLTLLEFCFDVDFYKEDLQGFPALLRLNLYKHSHIYLPPRIDTSLSYDRKFRSHVEKGLADEMKQAIADGTIKKIGDSPFEQTYNIPKDYMYYVKFNAFEVAMRYICRSLEDILALEFHQMLNLDMKIKKCKNCEHYFILKGNYQTEYCDQIRDGQTQTCQTLGAVKNYSQKVKENPALAIYSKYYKRYHARVKVNQIKPDAFKKWKYEAVVMRDKAVGGEITTQKFTEWLEGCFPKKK